MSEIENKALTDREKKLSTTIGLAAKARKVICGTPLICEGLRQKGQKKPVAVLVCFDASENTKKRLKDKCSFYETPLYELPIGMNELSSSVGKKSSVAAVGICDAGLSRAILGKLEQESK